MIFVDSSSYTERKGQRIKLFLFIRLPFYLSKGNILYSHFRKIVLTRVSNRNSVAHYVAERNAIFTAISARFVAHIPHPFAPNLRIKVSFLAHQQWGILGAIKV